jgi:1,2-diacylglycerol 3-beta-glucosyltransferase
MIVLSLLFGSLGLVLLLPTFTDLCALIRRWRGRTRTPATLPHDPPRLLFLVPAHNEELLITTCVRSLMELRYPRDRVSVVVIADNCRDQTAARARAAGGDCLERSDPHFPGKPHAIAWALSRLPWRDHDAVVIVDADSEVDPEFATALARSGPLRERGVQGYHKVLNPEETALTRLGALLAAANHRIGYPIKQRGDLNTPLLGNGMALGRDVLAEHGWPAFTICEDWEMYAALTAAGVRIDGAPDACVASQEARDLDQSASQRKRWTAGKLTVLLRYALPILRSRKVDLVQRLDALGELVAPGPALQLGGVVAMVGILLLLPVPAGTALAAILAASLVRPALYCGVALIREPRPWATIRALAFLPLYVLWRLGNGIGSLMMLGDRPWVRTTRHRPADPPVAPRPS